LVRQPKSARGEGGERGKIHAAFLREGERGGGKSRGTPSHWRGVIRNAPPWFREKGTRPPFKEEEKREEELLSLNREREREARQAAIKGGGEKKGFLQSLYEYSRSPV